MISLKHKQDGYRAMTDEVRRNQSGKIVAVHIPRMSGSLRSRRVINANEK